MESQLLWLGCSGSAEWKVGIHRAVGFCGSAVANVVPAAETMPSVPGKIVLSWSACSGSLAQSCSGGRHRDSKTAWISRKALWREAWRSGVVCHMPVNLYFLANVRRQVSLAGGNGGSQRMGVKALGMLCCQHPLCLNAESRKPLLESWNGQRLAARAR